MAAVSLVQLAASDLQFFLYYYPYHFRYHTARVGNTKFEIKRVDEIVYAAIEYEAAGY